MPEVITITAYRFRELEPTAQLRAIEAHKAMRDEAEYTAEDIDHSLDEALRDMIWTPLQVHWGGLHTQGQFLGLEGTISLAQLMKESGPMQMKKDLRAPDPRIYAPLLIKLAEERGEMHDPYWRLTPGSYKTTIEERPRYSMLSSERGYRVLTKRGNEWSQGDDDKETARNQGEALGARVWEWIRRLEAELWERLRYLDGVYSSEWFLREDIEEHYPDMRFTAEGKALNVIDGQLAL